MEENLIPEGFSTGSIHAGIRPNATKRDLALIVSDVPCTAAAVYTTNKVKAAPLHITKKHLENGLAQAIIVNSGNANACCPKAMENAEREVLAAAKKANLDPDMVLVASTGLIGQDMPIELIETDTQAIEMGQDWSGTQQAILTTDTKEKTASATVVMDGKTVHLYGFAKGSGMIHPNMGTMLAFILTDAKISAKALDAALKQDVKTTFNRVVVDGDTSTNDMCIVLANGKAQNTDSEEAVSAFTEALHEVMQSLAIQIAADGEGATRLLTVTVKDAKTEAQAETLAMSIISSSLVKAAMFGADANWGRVLCAMGYSGADFDPAKTSISFSSQKGSIKVCENGMGLDFNEGKALQILQEPDVTITADINEGTAAATCWGCDLTYEYVKINGEYRT